MLNYPLVLIFALLFTLISGLLLLRAERYLAGIARRRNDARARQSSHMGNPLRIGGVAVLAGVTFALGLEAPIGTNGFVSLLMLSVLPVLIAGLAEDLGYEVSPRGRFAAAIVSAVLAVTLLNAWAPRADIPGIDTVMTMPIVAIVMTVIFSSVFCHAVNLIDGMNGLAASVVVISALGAAAVAYLAGQPDIMLLALILAAATAGFLCLNWPVARLFLGDAGAYGLGHLLIWLLFLLVWRSSDVAVPALMLLIFWPIADVIHTVSRRISQRVPVFFPDRMHLHQKVRRLLDIAWFGYRGRWRSNPLATLLLQPFILAPAIAGVVLWDRPVAAWIALGAFFLLFSMMHVMTTRLARKWRKAAPGQTDTAQTAAMQKN